MSNELEKPGARESTRRAGGRTVDGSPSTPVTWVVDDRWRGRVAGVDAPNWFDLETGDRTKCVKRGHFRSVWRIVLGGDVVFAKVLKAGRASIMERIRRAVGWTALDREWRICQETARADAPFVRAVALGRRGGRTPAVVLITEAAEGGRELSLAWRDVGLSRVIRAGTKPVAALTAALAELYAKAHRAGFVHLDGHPGNILVVQHDDRFEAVFADASDAKIYSGRPPWFALVKSLAHLDHYMKRIATRTQRLRFLRRYLKTLPAPQREIWMQRRMVRAILVMEAVHAARLARQRDRRICRSGKYFSTFTVDGVWRATAVLALERRHLFTEAGLADFTLDRWRNLLGGVCNEAGEIDSLEVRLGKMGLGIRRDIPGGLFRALRRGIFGSPLWRIFFRCHALRHRDISAPLPLAYLERRTWFGGIADTMLVYRAPR